MASDRLQSAGYLLSNASTLVTITELMKETSENITVIMTLDYEFIPALPYPSAFRNLTSVWLDVGSCQDPDVPVQGNSTFIHSTSSAWTLPVIGQYKQAEGLIVFTLGHLHDVGEHIELIKNGDEVICDSIATYGGSPGFSEQDGNRKDIYSMTSCGGDMPLERKGTIKAGDSFGLRAHYDLSSHRGIREADGSLAPVMGIVLMYLASGADSGE